MEGSEMISRQYRGVTLVEVLTSMVIFALLIGMTSRLIGTAAVYPFVSDTVEPWLNYMEDTGLTFRQLPDESEYLFHGVYDDPFSGLKKPIRLNHLEMRVMQDAHNPGLLTAHFSATSFYGKTYTWKSYRYRR
jgi:prepilin-type N-terminal cleavage/methylation domain-containing protein